MTVFEMVKYHKQEYPSNIPLRFEEVAAHFDISKVKSILNYSLHTEYSYGKRKFDSSLISSFPTLITAQKDSIPQLWKSERWAEEFAHFVIRLVEVKSKLSVIEVHPPFDDYTDLNGFIKSYRVFEEYIHNEVPNTEFFIENRFGSIYHGGRFLMSKIEDIYNLCEYIENERLHLKIALDIPQVFTAHNANKRLEILNLMTDIKNLRDYIGGVHLWGKSRSSTGRKVAHCGDLTSYFEDDMETKKQFLESLCECFNDDIPRKLVLEVNSGNDDLYSIINDLLSVDIRFV
ncbi:MAG: hypothetical protein GXY21_02120 [Clostridiaceae bacterium]|nr:hypothetical protein [Clostridiaceae bacterium]